jgi:hypothetical protein
MVKNVGWFDHDEWFSREQIGLSHPQLTQSTLYRFPN